MFLLPPDKVTLKLGIDKFNNGTDEIVDPRRIKYNLSASVEKVEDVKDGPLLPRNFDHHSTAYPRGKSSTVVRIGPEGLFPVSGTPVNIAKITSLLSDWKAVPPMLSVWRVD